MALQLEKMVVLVAAPQCIRLPHCYLHPALVLLVKEITVVMVLMANGVTLMPVVVEPEEPELMLALGQQMAVPV